MGVDRFEVALQGADEMPRGQDGSEAEQNRFGERIDNGVTEREGEKQMTERVHNCRAIVTLAIALAVLPVLANAGDDRPDHARPAEIGVGYQGMFFALPTLGLVDDSVDLHALSIRAWGRRRLGGELDLTVSRVSYHKSGQSSTTLTAGGVFGKILYRLCEKPGAKFYVGIQAGVPAVEYEKARSGGGGSGGSESDHDVFSIGALVGTEFRFTPESPVAFNLDLGIQRLEVNVGETHGNIVGATLSGGVRYYF